MARARKTFADLGEAALIERIARRAGRVPGRDWALRIGDDAAILRPRAGEELVLSTDAQIEGTHFRFGRETPRVIGRRAMAVNLSDLAAMGAAPVGALLSIAAPTDAAVADLDAIVSGFVAEGAGFDCPLVGGNLARAPQWSLDVTIVGRCKRGRALRRRGVRPGDALFVTGSLGRGALARLRSDATGTPLRYVPTARVEAGRALATEAGVRACLDLSDGLATDLAHLLAGSGCGASIDVEALPTPRGLVRAAKSLELDPVGLATRAGEDYELLFAFRSPANSDPSGRLSRRLGVAVSRIGRITAENGIRGLPESPVGHHF